LDLRMTWLPVVEVLVTYFMLFRYIGADLRDFMDCPWRLRQTCPKPGPPGSDARGILGIGRFWFSSEDLLIQGASHSEG
jgi:hypothetical protein